MNVIRSALRPVKGRMRVLRAVRCMCWGLMAGAALCAAILLASFFVPMHDRALYLLLAALCPPALAGLAGLLWPVGTARAARKADDCGLKERVQTALAVQNRQDDMARLLRRDALRSLQTLRVRKAMPVRAARLPLYIAAGLMLACGAMFLIPNPQDAVLRAQRQLHQKIAKLTDKQLQELRKILGDLARETGRAKDQREAMTSISRAQEQLNRLLNEGKNAAVDALSQQGLDSLAQAMAQAQGDASQTLEDAMQAMDQQALSQALAEAAEQAAAGGMEEAAQALNAAAQAAASGSISGAAQALGQLTSASMAASQMSAALQSAKTAVSGAAQSAAGQGGAKSDGSGKGQGAGQGSGNGQGKGSGTGAGKGSTNEDAGYSQSNGAQRQAGSGMAQYKTGQYESIYDPTRLGDGGEISQSTGKVTQNGEHTQLQLTPGLGNTQGSVPYDQVAGEYRDAAVQSAQQDNLPDYARQWVNDYFTALLDQQ